MPRKNARIDINIGKLYMEMESVYKEVANEQNYSFDEGDENVFFRMYIPILQVMYNLIDKNHNKKVVYIRLYDDIIYFVCKDHEHKKYQLFKIKANDPTNNFNSTNAIDLLSKESISAIKEVYWVWGGFKVNRDDYFVDIFKCVTAAIYNAVVKLFQEQFSNYKSIKGNIIGFEFSMDCAGKRKFNPDEIKFCIQL